MDKGAMRLSREGTLRLNALIPYILKLKADSRAHSSVQQAAG